MNHSQKIVIQLFEQNQTGYDDNIGKITHIWQTFCERNIDDIQEPPSYSAGLEYLAGQLLLGPKRPQREVAEKYGTTPHKVSKCYRLIHDTAHDLCVSYWKAVVDERFEPRPISTVGKDELVKKILETPTFPGNYGKDMTPDLIFAFGDLLSYYYETSDIKVLWELFEINPYHPDLYTIIADFSNYDHTRKRILTKAVINGENAIDHSLMRELSGELWMEIDSRPYLRARAAFAAQMEREYDFDGAILQYRELMRLNEGDNQGIRFKLLPLYLQQKHLSEARALLDSIHESETFTLFYEAIYMYYKDGLSEDTIKLLKKADSYNPHFKVLLLNPKRREDRLSGYIQEREETEAAIAVEDTLQAWNWNKELTNALKKI